MATVEIDALQKHYGRFHALKDIAFTVEDGEFVVLVGPSGCGKSTLLRTIAGLEEVSDGAIRIGGNDVTDLEPRDRDIAMVFQSYALYPHMSVRDNMAFSLNLRKTPQQDIDARVAEAARILGIEPLLERKPRALSGGQRQRVAMGRAIVRHPQVFLFDEPLSNLDAKLRVQMRAEIRALHQRLGATSIYVTHDQVEAMTMADRIVVLEAGRIVQAGSPLELYERPVNRFVAEFIGSPSINLVPATVDGRNLRLPAGAITLPANVSGGSVIAGVRPEDLRPAADGPIAGTVRLVEHLGAETYVLFGDEDRDLSLCWRVGGTPAVEAGDPIRLTTDPSRIHLFHPETGARL
ncbi:ABC transporter ATP-binding protein [Jiella sonneratiae]|uniref:Sn-glycerol-3-phosphate ABC transporter ATP-binding protein UgpC n=1 Tax=Jiella sonneratiae TaxID=2816856 RepID=A0ABS3J591_9HYPH|nr:sn-glycerol-3-phosphate ABC transporter ATP-binding protein UgpC [Jiella sonneratiae]MBO0904846.1 sn-glycerol-3-phosphate ABC transporter ATP-binding protein UgpC [Jiella sonneratiae]